MVRPERRELLTGASPVRISARASGSRPQPKGEILPVRAGRRKPVKQQGAKERAATSSERCSLDKLSAARCLGGPSRSCHGEGNRQQPGLERLLDLPGVEGRWHVSKEERGTGETLPGSPVRRRRLV